MAIEPVNWKMIAHPMNWITITLMLIIAGTFGHLLLSYFEIEPATKNSYQQVPGNAPAPQPAPLTT